MRYEKGEEPDKAGTIKFGSFKLFVDKEFAAMDSAHEHKLQVQRGDFLHHQLRHPGGDRSLLGVAVDDEGNRLAELMLMGAIHEQQFLSKS